MQKIEKDNLIDKRIALTIVLQFCILLFNYTIKEVLGIDNTSIRAIISAFFMIVIGVVYLYNLPYVFKRKGVIITLTYLAFILLFCINIIIYSTPYSEMLDISFWFFLICLPSMFYILALEDRKILLELMLRSKYLQSFMGIILGIYIVSKDFHYDMVFSYLLIVPVILLLHEFIFIKKRISDLLIVLVISFFIIAIGSRGPLISIYIYIVLALLYSNKTEAKNLKNIILLVIVVSLSLIILFNYMRILEQLELFLSKIGIISRTIFLLKGEYHDISTGRYDFYTIIFNKLTESPFIGFGIGGDRVLLDGTYPHNIFLEILTNFGWLAGIPICLMFTSISVQGFFRKNKEHDKQLWIMFFCIGFVPILMSGSYWTSYLFWMFIGICLVNLFETNKKNDFIKVEE